MASATLLYIGTRQGLSVVSRPGTSVEWRITRHALDGRPVAGLALGVTFPPRLLAAVPEVGLFHSANGGREWMLTLPLAVSALVADPADPDRLYAGLDARPDSEASPAIHGVAPASMVMLSADGGLTWEPGGELPAAPTRVTSLAVAAGGAPGTRVLWAGLEAGGALYSADGGRHWQGAVPGLGARDPVRALASIGPAATDLFAATWRGIYRLTRDAPAGAADPTSGALAWRAPADQTPRDVTRLLALGRVHPPLLLASALLAVDGAGALLRSEDAGVTWKRLALQPAGTDVAAGSEVAALAAHPEYPDRGYVGTRGGQIYETRTRGSAWEAIDVRPGGDLLSLTVAVLK